MPIIIYGRCIFDFIRNCQTFSQILNYCTFPLAVCDVLISLHPCQKLYSLVFFKNLSGISLVVQWLGLNAFTAVAWVQSLIRELRSHKWSEVAQSCPTLWEPMDCSPLGFSVHGIFQPTILEWVAIFFSRGSSPPRNWTCVSCCDRWILYYCTAWEALLVT